ncbi:MAG: leucine-rich repeat domain-containing protein [Prevotella sp.]|nr:leucine-rich repeat domain-containing protein [Prevotella sp.]MDY3936447.1 leucine-rich repeat domain-containing protein [Prevotella sp.]MDY4217187.1 leucine-rich repeat domain-containing protein [Prevotella sp.]
MKKIYILFSFLLLLSALPLYANVGKGSISFTSKQAVNKSIKVTVETGSAAETKIDETFTISGAKVKSAKGGILELIVEKPEALVTLNGDFTLFKCEKALLATLDLKNAKKLRKLHCKRNTLTELDVTYLENLEELDCSSNQIATMDLEACEKLTTANFSSNRINNLYLPESETLTFIDCSVNQSINELNVSKCKGLKTLKCYTCGLNETKVDKLVEQLPTHASGAKIYVRFGSNGEYSFTKRHIKRLNEKGWIVYDTDNQICEGKEDWGIIRFETMGEQTLFFCTAPAPGVGSNLFFSEGIVYDPLFSYGNMVQITCTKAGKYTIKCKQPQIWFDGCPDKITMFDLSEQSYLKEFRARQLGATSLLLPANAEKISVTQSGWLTTVSIPQNNHLCNLTLSENNSLATLDLTNSTQLEQLDVQCCQLEQINLTGCTQLKTIRCYGNRLKKVAFDQLVTALADHSSESGMEYRIVLHSDRTKEWNYCTRTQVEALKAKGWMVLELHEGTERSYEGTEGEDPYIDKTEGDDRFGTDRLTIHFKEKRGEIHCTKMSINEEDQTLQQLKDNTNIWTEGTANIARDKSGITFQAYDDNITFRGKITDIENLGFIRDGEADIDASQAISLKRFIINDYLFASGIRSLILPKDNTLAELSLRGMSETFQFNIEDCKGLKNVDLLNCHFKELNFSNAKNLEKLVLGGLLKLTNISFSPTSKLKELRIENCPEMQTSTLIPASVEILSFFNCRLYELPELPSGLQILECVSNEIKALPILPATLIELKCDRLNLTSLDLTPCKELTTLSVQYNQIRNIKFPTESKLKTINCQDNGINETDMTAFVEALPKTNNGTLLVWGQDNSNANYCNTEHVAAAKAKGWNIVDSQGNPYPGITPTGISTPTTIWENTAPYYDLQGRRIEKPTRSGIYIRNGRKVIIR